MNLQELIKPDQSDTDWEECETYWVCNAPQRSEKWFKYRKYRITGSNFATAANMSIYKTADDFCHEIVHDIKPVFSEFALRVMQHGTDTEDEARQWYEKHTGTKVKEYGLVVPKWDFLLGSSVDGIVEGTNGIIEIKCPERAIYKPLADYVEQSKQGIKFPKFYKDHIKPEHYCQMQGGMAVLGKDWCDYVVYVKKNKEKKIRGEAVSVRIYYDKNFWENDLYPKLKDFEKKLEIGLNKKWE
jgi:putative phage-type endonuclease